MKNVYTEVNDYFEGLLLSHRFQPTEVGQKKAVGKDLHELPCTDSEASGLVKCNMAIII